MSSNRSKNASSRFIRQDLKDKSIRADTANKENVLSDLSAHLAVHAERMKLLKRAEEGLEKLIADPFISRTADCANEYAFVLHFYLKFPHNLKRVKSP